MSGSGEVDVRDLVRMLGAVADASNGAPSAEETFRVTLEEICAVTGWPAGHVYAVGPGDRLTDTGTWHVADPSREADARALMGGAGPGGAAAAAVESGEPRWMTFPGEYARALCAIPITAGDDAVGVLEFLAEDSDQPDEVLLDALQTAGVVAGRVVERAKAAEELRRARADAEEARAERSRDRPRPAAAVAAAPTGNPALRDAPTGLFTPTYLEEALRIETARAERGRRAVTVIAVAADALDAFGDRAAAEAAVEAVGTFLGGRIRKGDLAARYGEQFIVVMPGVSVGMGRVRTQQLRKGVEGIGLLAPDGGALTASAGFACFPDHGGNETDLLEAAREALERAQAEGGGKLEMAKLSLKRWTGKS